MVFIPSLHQKMFTLRYRLLNHDIVVYMGSLYIMIYSLLPIKMTTDNGARQLWKMTG